MNYKGGLFPHFKGYLHSQPATLAKDSRRAWSLFGEGGGGGGGGEREGEQISTETTIR